MTIVFLAIVSLIGQVSAAPTAKDLNAEYMALIHSERDELNAIADRLAKSGKEEAAAVARGFIEPEAPKGRTRFVPLPEVSPEIKPEASVLGPEEARLVRERTAKALFVLANKTASKTVRRLSIADRCLRRVLARDPNHTEARRLLGYLSYQGGWATPHAVGLLKSGHVLHPKFGWVLADWVTKLDQGKLPSEFDGNGKAKSWLPANEANALHREWQFAWMIDTAPHFQIESNVDLDEAVAFGQRLEVFYQFFLSEFADLIGPERLPLAQRFDSKKMKPAASPNRFKVSYFAEKAEYVDFLRSKFGRDEKVSLGFTCLLKKQVDTEQNPKAIFIRTITTPSPRTRRSITKARTKSSSRWRASRITIRTGRITGSGKAWGRTSRRSSRRMTDQSSSED